MIVSMERSGGFAGMTLRTEIDTAQLEQEERQTLEELVAAADFFNLPANIEAPNTGADRFVYVLFVEHGGISHTVEVGEGGMPAHLQPLIEHLNLHARRNRLR